jgi:FlaA1/EpsC-like NDP-sugar epimerase
MASVRVFKSYLKTPFLILLALEVCIIFFSVYLAAYIRYINDPPGFFAIVEDIWSRAAILAVITPITMLATGLYQGNIREGMSGIFLRLVISLGASGVFITILFYLFPDLYLGRSIVLISLLQSFFIVGTLRAVFLELVDTETFKKRVVVYGAGKTAAHIDLKLRRKSDRRSFTIVGYILLEHQKQQQAVADEKLVKVESTLLQFAKSHAIDEIVVATSDIKADIPVDELVECKMNGWYSRMAIGNPRSRIR